MAYLKSLYNILRNTYWFCDGSNSRNLIWYLGYNVDFWMPFIGHGLLSLLTLGISSLLECLYVLFHYQLVERIGVHGFLRMVCEIILCAINLFFILSKTIVALAGTMLLAIFIVPYHAYQYYTALKESKRIMVLKEKDPIWMRFDINDTNTEKLDVEPKNIIVSDENPLPFSSFGAVSKFSKEPLNFSAEDVHFAYEKNSAREHIIITAIKFGNYLNIETGVYAHIPTYTAESKKYISRLIWLGIISQDGRFLGYMYKPFLVPKLPFPDNLLYRWATENDCSPEVNTLYMEYFFMALFALKFNIPEEVLPKISSYISDTKKPISLPERYNNLVVHAEKNAHLFFLQQARQTMRITSKRHPNHENVTEALSQFGYIRQN